MFRESGAEGLDGLQKRGGGVALLEAAREVIRHALPEFFAQALMHRLVSGHGEITALRREIEENAVRVVPVAQAELGEAALRPGQRFLDFPVGDVDVDFRGGMALRCGDGRDEARLVDLGVEVLGVHGVLPPSACAAAAAASSSAREAAAPRQNPPPPTAPAPAAIRSDPTRGVNDPSHGPGPDKQKDEENEDEHGNEERGASRQAPVILRRLSGPFVLPLGGRDHGVKTGREPPGIIALPEPGLEIVIEDLLAGHIRQRPFEAVASLDARFVILHEDEQDRAVVVLLLAHAPGLEKAVAVIVERIVGLELGIDDGDDLVRRLAFEAGQLCVQRIGGGGVRHMRIVVEIMLRFRRHHLGRPGRHAGGQQHESQPQAAYSWEGEAHYCAGAGVAPPKLKFTAGGLSAPCTAWK